MTRPADQRADKFPIEIIFREERGERVIDVAALQVHGDALHVARGPRATVLPEGQGGQGRGRGGLRRRQDGGRAEQENRERLYHERRWGSLGTTTSVLPSRATTKKLSHLRA